LCGRWVLLLVLQGRDNDAVRAELTADDLPCPTDTELDAMRGQYKVKGFRLKSGKNTALFEQLGLEAFLPKTTPEAEEALAVLREPRLRELTEAGLIVGVPTKAIAQTIRQYLKVEVSPPVIDLYGNTFCDVTAVVRARLKVLVHERIRLAVMRAVADEDHVAAQRAITADARAVATALPATPLAWSSVLMSLGHSPGRRELVDVIGQMEGLAVVRASESLLRAEPGDERRAEAFVGVLQKIREIRETVITPEAQLTRQLVSFRVRHEVKAMPTVAELREGGDEVTVDIGPPLTEPEGK
jgi:hypothetical protein